MLVSLRHPACLELLIATVADVQTYEGLMELATYFNCIESVIWLLDACVDPIEKHEETYSPLATAIHDNHPDTMALLLSRGADPNLKGQDVPLRLAVNRPELLKQLLARGADVSLYKGLLELAVYYDSPDSIPILLEAGVPADEKHL